MYECVSIAQTVRNLGNIFIIRIFKLHPFKNSEIIWMKSSLLIRNQSFDFSRRFVYLYIDRESTNRRKGSICFIQSQSATDRLCYLDDGSTMSSLRNFDFTEFYFYIKIAQNWSIEKSMEQLSDVFCWKHEEWRGICQNVQTLTKD